MTTSPRLLLSEDSNVINLGNSLHFKRLAERLCDKFDFRTVVARRTKNSFISQENIDLKSKVTSSYHLCVECFSQLSFDSEVYTKSATAADFVYISESNENCEKHSTQR